MLHICNHAQIIDNAWQYRQLGTRLSLAAALGEAVGGGAGLDDVAAEGEPVHDGGVQRRGSVKILVQPENDSLEAIATEFFSSRSVRTWTAATRSTTAPAPPGASRPPDSSVGPRRRRKAASDA
jgi:hypothetical protein